MSVSFENKETNRGVLTFTISQEQIKPALDRVFESVKKRENECPTDGKDPTKQSGSDRIFYQQSHRLGSKRLLQNQSRMGSTFH